MRPKTKQRLITIVKFAISFAILGFLFYKASQEEELTKLASSKKNWLFLFGGLLMMLAAISISFYRWFLLVRALEIPCKLFHALRLGFIGFLFNFLTVGTLGGDAVRALFIARENPQFRTEAVTTVFVDRAIGLFTLLLIVSCTYLVMPTPEKIEPTTLQALTTLCNVSMTLTGIGLCGLCVLMFVPGIAQANWAKRIYQVPKIGGVFEKALGSFVAYRRRIHVLFVSIGLSVLVHGCFTISYFLIAHGLSSEANLPSFLSHFVIVPMTNVANAIPLPAGLGASEAMIDYLYVAYGNREIGAGFGLVVQLCARVMQMLIASLGVVFYFARKKEIEEVIRESDSSEEG